MRFTMERQPLLWNGAKSLFGMVGVGRIELPTPAMSKRFSCRHTAVFRGLWFDVPGTVCRLFAFISARRFIVNLRPLLHSGAAQ